MFFSKKDVGKYIEMLTRDQQNLVFLQSLRQGANAATG